jgi:hypothetical protein
LQHADIYIWKQNYLLKRSELNMYKRRVEHGKIWS